MCVCEDMSVPLCKPSDFNPKLQAEKCVSGINRDTSSQLLRQALRERCESVSSVFQVLSRVLDQRKKGH